MVATLAPPRLATPRRPERPTRGDRVAYYLEALGYEPHLWQRLLADVFGEEDPATGLLWYRQCGAEVSRQSGKTAWIAARTTQQCLDYPRQHCGFTSQDRNNAVRAWAEHVELVLDSELAGQVKRVTRANGAEILEFQNGSWYRPVTPSRMGARGLSLDLAVVDEALSHGMGLLAALGPTLSARPGSQFVTLSNAGDETSELLIAMRERTLPVLDDPEAKRAWMEWSANPDLPGFSAYDEELWAQVMPTLGQPHGLDIEFVREMAGVMDELDFRREYLCIPTTAASALVIPPEVWRILYRTDVQVGDQVALGIDVTPERDACALVAAAPVGDYIALEVIQAGEGTAWLLERTIDVARRWSCPVAIDVGSAAASLIPALEAAEVELAPITGRLYARACGWVYDQAMETTLTHLDQYQLNDAVAGATKRPLGDAWAWNRRGGVNISPLVAATLAAWTAGTTPHVIPQVH